MNDDAAKATAHHEAAHVVVSYRVTGDAGGVTSIVPNLEAGTLGHVTDYLTVSTNEEDLEARVLSCYAGRHADRRFGSRDRGYEPDEEAAAEVLRMTGWEHREQELRTRSGELVERYWPEIEAVANELVLHRELDPDEVALICDAVAGDSEAKLALASYRVLKSNAGGTAPGIIYPSCGFVRRPSLLNERSMAAPNWAREIRRKFGGTESWRMENRANSSKAVVSAMLLSPVWPSRTTTNDWGRNDELP